MAVGDIDIHHITAALARTAHRIQLDGALVSAADTLGADLIGVSLLDPDDALREIVATGAPIDPTAYRLSDYPATAAALRDAVMLEVHADQPDSDPAERAVLHRYGMASMLLVPLLIEGRPIGVLELNRSRPHRWTGRDVGHARSLAEHVAHAVIRLNADPGWRAEPDAAGRTESEAR